MLSIYRGDVGGWSAPAVVQCGARSADTVVYVQYARLVSDFAKKLLPPLSAVNAAQFGAVAQTGAL
jgi:hypothetical protein